MKARILAVLLLAGAAAAPFQPAEAGPLLDALRNRVGQAVFLGKVAKANLASKVHRVIFNKILPCFRDVC